MDIEDVDALKPRLQDLASRVGTADRKLLAATVAALDQHIGLVAGGQFEPSAHLSTIQRVLVAGEHGRGTPGEQALAAIALARRDLGRLISDKAAAVAEREAAFQREELAVRDALAKVAQLQIEHRAALAAHSAHHASCVAALEARHDLVMRNVKQASVDASNVFKNVLR